jgi:toxin ParE1/3/4
MSFKPQNRFRVTPRARDDLQSIGRYTEQVWGRNQRNAYLKDIASRFYWLAEHPELGKRRDEIGEGFYSFPQGHHVVFYVISTGFIDIIGVSHKEMVN